MRLLKEEVDELVGNIEGHACRGSVLLSCLPGSKLGGSMLFGFPEFLSKQLTGSQLSVIALFADDLMLAGEGSLMEAYNLKEASKLFCMVPGKSQNFLSPPFGSATSLTFECNMCRNLFSVKECLHG